MMWTFSMIVLSVIGVTLGQPTHKKHPESKEHHLKEQENALRTLGCQPVLQAVHLPAELGGNDPLTDEFFDPEWIAVKRCNKNVSFCGDFWLGMHNGTLCLPTDTEQKKILVYFEDEDGKHHYRTISVTEHNSCQCL